MTVSPVPATFAPTLLAHVVDRDLLRGAVFIDGEWSLAEDGGLLPVRNPANGDWLGSVAAVGRRSTQRAIEAAARAWPAWRAMTPDARGAILRRWAAGIRAAADDLSSIMTLEQGKPLAEARAEIEYAASFIDWFAEEGRRAYGDTIPSHRPGKRLLTMRVPIGVCAAITPWNFPSAMITRKAAAALAAGCPMIVRPADETPFSALALAVLAERAGLPRGVLQVITGDAVEIARTFTTSDAVRALSFTGSTDVGKLLLKASADTVKRVSLELGGHAPFLVFEDTAIETAARLAVGAKFQTSGQDCLAANRILVQRLRLGEFVEHFVRMTRELRVGPGLVPGVDIGPLISQRAVARCAAQVADAVGGGARLAVGGKVHAAGATFFEPTVLVNVTPAMRIWREETFGPIAAITAFDTEAEAISLANDTHYGLAAYICSTNLSRVMNTDSFTGPPIPFGGIKESGLGREGSRYGLDEYTELKYLCLAIDAA
jgi:succinate-semialdehyde dehydrogenase